jgi:hypothetical protein
VIRDITQNIRYMFSSEVDFPKLFSHVIDIEISKFCVLRAVFSHVVDIEISNFARCARDIEIPSPCARERAVTVTQESVWLRLSRDTEMSPVCLVTLGETASAF